MPGIRTRALFRWAVGQHLGAGGCCPGAGERISLDITGPLSGEGRGRGCLAGAVECSILWGVVRGAVRERGRVGESCPRGVGDQAKRLDLNLRRIRFPLSSGWGWPGRVRYLLSGGTPDCPGMPVFCRLTHPGRRVGEPGPRSGSSLVWWVAVPGPRWGP